MAIDEKRPSEHHSQKKLRIGLLILIVVLLIASGVVLWLSLAGRLGFRGSDDGGNSKLATDVAAISASLQPTASPTSAETVIPSEQPLLPVAPVSSELIQPPVSPQMADPKQPLSGAAILSIMDGSYAHLFAFLPAEMRFIRLTTGEWQDIDPALSPNGKMLAFASNRSGYWNLYVMMLDSGIVRQINNTPEYEGNPSWSPDNRWLVYDAYIPDETGGNLELFVQELENPAGSVRLTTDPAADFAPAWSPNGRTIAFVSTRGGEKDIWLADLNKSADMFTNISREPTLVESAPAWSPDGSKLCWSATDPEGIEALHFWNLAHPNDRAWSFENGSLPAWGPNGEMLLAVYRTPNRSYLTGYRLLDGKPFLPLLDVAGDILGITWGIPDLSLVITSEGQAAAQFTPSPLWLPRLEAGGANPGDRVPVVQLTGVQAPLAMLQDRADEAFMSLRERVALEVGWDFLSNLDQAYVPLTSSLGPGFLQDWLYTGRAFQFNSAPVSAGWVVTVREDYGAQTFWRVYLRARYQDGTQGAPLNDLPWDLASRLSGDPRAYEDGGTQQHTVPAGYWIDFTRLAAAYGWERLPSLSSWRVAYTSVRYNEFVLRQGLDWFSAMLEVYPRQALDTPTPVSSPTITPTFTSTPTNTPTVTETPYREPTITPSLTRRPSLTPTPSNTRRPSLTPSPTS